MSGDILETTSVQRLQGLLKQRYGKGLELRYMVNTTDWNSWGARVASGDLFIPIHLHGTFLGLAKVPSVQDLPSASIDAITEVVRLILEPALYRRFLDRSETGATAVGESEQIQLVREAQAKTVDSLAAKAILLHSMNPYRIQKVAMQLHETAERWAMLRFSDMKSFGSVTEIKALGKATIFVEDLLLVSPEELQILNNYLQDCDPDSDPLIVVGSTRHLNEIIACGHYDKTLTIELARFSAELDRWPQDEKALKQALEFCLRDGDGHRLDF